MSEASVLPEESIEKSSVVLPGRANALLATVGAVSKWSLIIVGAVATLIMLFFGSIALLNSFIPSDGLDPIEKTPPSGVTLANAFKGMVNEELDRGWVPNDIFGIHIYLGNMGDFQLGEQIVWKGFTYQWWMHLARERTTDQSDPDLDHVNSAVNNRATKFWFPSYEKMLREATASTDAYIVALPTTGHFSGRADNLSELMAAFAGILGNRLNELAQAHPNHRLDDPAHPDEVIEAEDDALKLGFFEASRVFYQAKGEAYATLRLLQAIRVECNDVLVRKNALRLVDDAIYWLRLTVELNPLLVLNSSRDGVFANHLDNLSASYGQARAKINSLADVLRNG